MGDFHYRHRQFETALQEFGRVSKGNRQEDPIFRKQVSDSLAALLRPKEYPPSSYRPPSSDSHLTQQLRVTRHMQDANRNSDQSFDDRGLQVNEHLAADVPGRDGLRANFVIDLDGFRNGHDDVRYRTLLADFYENSSHLGLGDSATFTSPYFMRGSRYRGLDLIVNGPVHEFQALAGAYPFWLKEEGQYIYPRAVLGLRDRWHFLEDRFRIGGNFVKSMENERMRTIDPSNQPRDNAVMSMDQEIKVIPDVWFLTAAEAYSMTHTNLQESRFGDEEKLEDVSFQAESRFIHPWFLSKTRFERTGPDFRLLTDNGIAFSSNPAGITADRQFIQQTLNFKPWGPFNLDLEGSWIRNNLHHNDNLGQVRQSWYTANLHILTPRAWPQIGLRESLYDTISIPGSSTRPSQNRTSLSELEVSRQFGLLNWSGFSDYQLEHPLKDHPIFNDDESWSVGTRLSHPLGNHILLNGRYRYQAFNEVFDEIRQRGIRHEANGGGSIRLWSTASLFLNYTFLHGKLINPGGTGLTHTQEHGGTVGFGWPYTHTSWDKRRKLTISPGVTCHLSDFGHELERRSLFATYLNVGYDFYPTQRLELRGEYGYDHDQERADVRSAQSRIWFLWTAQL